MRGWLGGHVSSIGVERDGRDWTVRGLRLPDPLIALLAAGLWRDPQDAVLRAVMPWCKDPLIFLSTVDRMQRESGSLDRLAADDASARLFRLRRGSRVSR